MQYNTKESPMPNRERQTQTKTQTQSQIISAWLKTSAAALLLSSALLPGVSRAEGPFPPEVAGHHQGCHMPPRGPGVHHGPGMMLQGLNLSDEQETQIFNLMHSQKPKLHENDLLIRSNQKALMEMTTARTFDAAKAESLSQAIGQAMASNLLIRAQTDQQIYQMLASDQKKALEDRRKKAESGMRSQNPF